MALRRNTLEGFAVGVQPTASASGGASGDPFNVASFGGTTGTVVDTPVPRGTRALGVVAPAGTANTGLVEFLGAVNRQQTAQVYLRLAALPSAEFTVLQHRHSAGASADLIKITTAGALRFSSGSAGAQITASTSPVLALNTWYLIDSVTEQAVAPTATNGITNSRVIRVSDGVVFFSHSVADANVGTVNPDRVRYGKTGGAGSCDMFVAYPAHNDGGTAFIAAPNDFTAPTAPTLIESPPGEVDITWPAIPGATSYDVRRAPDAAGAPGTAVTIATGLTVPSFSDPGRLAATRYWYSVRGVN